MNWARLAGGASLVFVLGACAPTAVQQPLARNTAAIAVPPMTPTGLEAIMGRTAGVLAGQLGAAALDVREGSARKLQFASSVCVLDAYLYPPASGPGEPIVTYVDARRPDGSDFDRASCLAALTAQKQVR
jgi:hypothetical protein